MFGVVLPILVVGVLSYSVGGQVFRKSAVVIVAKQVSVIGCDHCLPAGYDCSQFRGRHGGWKKEGGGKPHEGHPSQKGFWTPLRLVRFPPPSGVIGLFFL